MKRLIAILIFIAACQPQRQPATPTRIIAEQTIIAPIETPDVTFAASHDLSDDDARAAAQSLAQSLEKYGVRWTWQNNIINFQATSGILNGVYGTLTLKHPHVTVDIYRIPAFIPDSIVTQRVSGRIQVYFNID